MASTWVGERIVESEVTMDCNKLQWILVYFKLICLIVTTLNGCEPAPCEAKNTRVSRELRGAF